MAEFTNGYLTYDCPESLVGAVSLQIEARPIDLDLNKFKQTSITTRGALGRRLLVRTAPNSLRRNDDIAWSSLSVTTYGGTLLSWDRLESHGAIDSDEIATVALSPGQVKIRRIATEDASVADRYSIDVVVMPGGIAVDDTVVRLSALWMDDGTPLPANRISPQFVTVRHPPGLDTVEASVELTYVVRTGNNRDEWVCTAETRLTLIDRESLHQPFWDLGLGSTNASRRQRLALFDPALGAVRLVFESPASAHSFATWLRDTRATQVGAYAVGVFQQPTPWGTRPFGPISDDLMSTLRRVTNDDVDKIAVGLAGDP